MKHCDLAVYVQDGTLLFEQDAQRLTVSVECTRNTAEGQYEIARTSLTLAEAIRARRALGRTIRALRFQMALSA